MKNSLLAERFFLGPEVITLARIIVHMITLNIFVIILSQCCRKESTKTYNVATVPPVMKTRRTDKTQSSTEYVPVEKEEDSFAKKTPVKRLAKRSIEIRSKAPVDREREDYKTFSGIKLPMSDADLDK